VCVALCPVTSIGETTEATKTDEVRQIIRDLGASQFVVRENATKQLFELGAGAQSEITFSELTRASQQSDREVRERATRILDLLKSRLREEGLKRFLAGEQIDNVPGWKQFSEKYGESESSRSVFTSILKEEWDLLAICLGSEDESADRPAKNGAASKPEDSTDGAAEVTKRNAAAPSQIAVRRMAITDRYTEVIGQYGYQKIPLGSMLSFYLIGEAAPESFDFDNQLFHLMISAPQLRQQLRGTPRQDTRQGVIRQIVRNWMMASIDHNSRYETQALSTALTNGMGEEAKLVAAKILKNPDSLVVIKRNAMQTFIVFRDTKGIELIEPYLMDETPLTPNRKKLQLRDIAIVCLMDLHGHDLAEIGVRRVAKYGSPYDFQSLGFDNDEERQKAFDLFEELQDEKARKKRESEKKRAKGP